MEIFYDYIFWILIAALIFHLLEEQLCGWLPWVNKYLNFSITEPHFYTIQCFALFILVLCAIFGWMVPVLSLAGAAALLIDAVFFHILLSFRKKNWVPGGISAVILFIPLCTFTYMGALKGGVSLKIISVSFLIGFLIATYPIFMLSLNKKHLNSENPNT